MHFAANFAGVTSPWSAILTCAVFKKHCIEESKCLTPRDFTFFCLFATYFWFVLFCPLLLVHFVVDTISVNQKYAHHTLTHNFPSFHPSTIYLLTIFFISNSDVCMAVSAEVQTKAPQANPLRSKDLQALTQAMRVVDTERGTTTLNSFIWSMDRATI